MNIVELKWQEHLVCTNRLQLCENTKDKIAIKFFEMISNAYPKKTKKNNIKNGKTNYFWQLHFSTKLPKEALSNFCNDSIDNSEIEGILSSDFTFRNLRRMLHQTLEKHFLIWWIRYCFMKFVVLKWKNHFFTIILIQKNTKTLKIFSMWKVWFIVNYAKKKKIMNGGNI